MSRIQVTTLSLLLGALFFLPSSSFAQRLLGVRWNVPQNSQEAISQLDFFSKLHIQYLEVDQVVSDRLWNEIQARNFKLFVQVPIRYPVIQTFLKPDSSTIDIYQRFVDGYAGRNIAAFGAFVYGQTTSSSFVQAFAPLASELDSMLSAPIYFKDWNFAKQPIDSLFGLKVVRVKVSQDFESIPDSNFIAGNAFLYAPLSSLQGLMTPLKWFLQKTSINPDAILFFDSSWLLNFTKEHTSAGSILANFATLQTTVFPLPQEHIPEADSHSVIVLILLFLWGTFAVNYSFVPMYRKSLFRYFFNHTFFVEDVIKRHIRSIEPSLIILGQHIVMGGIFLYSMAIIFLSRNGLDVIYHYIPALGIFGEDYFSFFLMGSIIMLIWELVCLFWLYLTNRKLHHFSQISILYSWLLQLNIITISIIVNFFLAESNSFLLPVFLFLFVLISFLAFPIAAFDTVQYLEKYPFWYSISTIGLYLLITGGILIVFFTSNYLINILSLAASIS